MRKDYEMSKYYKKMYEKSYPYLAVNLLHRKNVYIINLMKLSLNLNITM